MGSPDIAEQLARWRKHCKMTQAQLEEKAGLGHNTVSRIENRSIRSPHFMTVQKMATAMGLSTEQLLYGSPPQAEKISSGKNFKALMQADLEALDEEMCNDLYPIWKNLLELLRSRKGE
jgi:transcriptional regulator with XRE-family HTH domain